MLKHTHVHYDACHSRCANTWATSPNVFDMFTRSPVVLSPPALLNSKLSHSPYAPRAATPVPQGKTRIALSPSGIPCLAAANRHPAFKAIPLSFACVGHLHPNSRPHRLALLCGLGDSAQLWCSHWPIATSLRDIRTCMYVDRTCFVCVRRVVQLHRHVSDRHVAAPSLPLLAFSSPCPCPARRDPKRHGKYLP